MILLFGLIYTTGIFFTQVVTDYRLELQQENVVDASILIRYFGSLEKSIMVLIQAILGGVSWREVTMPLQEEIHWSVSLAFCMYIIFSVLAAMNVVTGVFVDSAVNSAKNDKEIYLINSVRSMFRRLDLDLAGEITWEQFEQTLDEAELRHCSPCFMTDSDEMVHHGEDVVAAVEVEAQPEIRAPISKNDYKRGPRNKGTLVPGRLAIIESMKRLLQKNADLFPMEGVVLNAEELANRSWQYVETCPETCNGIKLKVGKEYRDGVAKLFKGAYESQDKFRKLVLKIAKVDWKADDAIVGNDES
eukprot:CAMPEP_0169194570 /NCGR_PEP_ID=MMETSP1016-20121227/6763_1 /TAXON_ID=342587 /ORGANISM="Karlodinium micrum, Strain CCMP2283" /LENGTH=302 /DNA_ID=CAMNT_0009271075 /DNA_START=718 /DNA_END=1623 /DNA_ORIENTATION=+